MNQMWPCTDDCERYLRAYWITIAIKNAISDLQILNKRAFKLACEEIIWGF